MENQKKKLPVKVARKGKMRGPGRQRLTLGGQKKQKNAEKRKLKRKMNKDLGKAGIRPKRKSRAEQAMQKPPVSVLFVENTKGGLLAAERRDETGMDDSFQSEDHRDGRDATVKVAPQHQPMGCFRLWTVGLPDM